MAGEGGDVGSSGWVLGGGGGLKIQEVVPLRFFPSDPNCFFFCVFWGDDPPVSFEPSCEVLPGDYQGHWVVRPQSVGAKPLAEWEDPGPGWPNEGLVAMLG